MVLFGDPTRVLCPPPFTSIEIVNWTSMLRSRQTDSPFDSSYTTSPTVTLLSLIHTMSGVFRTANGRGPADQGTSRACCYYPHTMTGSLERQLCPHRDTSSNSSPDKRPPGTSVCSSHTGGSRQRIRREHHPACLSLRLAHCPVPALLVCFREVPHILCYAAGY